MTPQTQLNQFISKKKKSELPKDPSERRQWHIARAEMILREYPHIKLSKLVRKYYTESGLLEIKVIEYFKIAVARLKAQGINREWG